MSFIDSERHCCSIEHHCCSIEHRCSVHRCNWREGHRYYCCPIHPSIEQHCCSSLSFLFSITMSLPCCHCKGMLPSADEGNSSPFFDGGDGVIGINCPECREVTWHCPLCTTSWTRRRNNTRHIETMHHLSMLQMQEQQQEQEQQSSTLHAQAAAAAHSVAAVSLTVATTNQSPVSNSAARSDGASSLASTVYTAIGAPVWNWTAAPF